MKTGFLPLLLGVLAMPSVCAETWTVGGDSACTHPDMQSAIDTAVAAPDGPHRLHLVEGTILLPGMLEIIAPAGDLVIEGGYANCSAEEPGEGSDTVLNQNVPGNRVLYLSNPAANPRRTVTLQNILLLGGDPDLADTLGGGGALVIAHATLALERGARVIGNAAANGGGVSLYSSSGAAAAELILRDDAKLTSNEAIGTGSAGNGGAIYATGTSTVQIVNGTINSNFARRAGGGVALDGTGAALLVRPPPEPDVDAPIQFLGNIAGEAPLVFGEGLGGAIYSHSGRVDISAPDVEQLTTWLVSNEAGYGGAMHVENSADPGAPATYVDLRNTYVGANIAHGKGGAFFSRNRVEWRISHSTHGKSCVRFGARVPCSIVAGNRADNDNEPGTPGGGVVYALNDPGALGSWFLFDRTQFRANSDPNGQVAVAVALNQGVLSFRRSVFVDNQAGSGSAFGVLLANAANVDTNFAYNTVLANDVDTLFFINGGEFLTQGSIFWAPGTPIWNPIAGATMLHRACLIAHSADDLPGGVTVVDPDLDARYAPRGGSPAIDHCDEKGGVAPGIDLYGDDPGYDVAGVAEIFDTHDLGAVENRDILFFGGFGERFAN
jgi:hypothetical protein